MPYHYSFFGLSVFSDAPLPRLLPKSVATSQVTAAEVRVWWGTEAARFEKTDHRFEAWHTSFYCDENSVPNVVIDRCVDAGLFRLRYADGSQFIVDRNGTNVWADWPETLSQDDALPYLLCAVMGFVLFLRGIVCLHASAVATGDRAFAIIGPSGAGKSTTAAAFAKLGYRVLSDDIISLLERDGFFWAQPSYPLIYLLSDAAKLLYSAEDALPVLAPTWDKYCVELARKESMFQHDPLPLRAVYLLGERSIDPAAPFIEPVQDRGGMVNLLAGTFSARLPHKGARAHEFSLLGRLAARTPLRRVVAHQDLARLSHLCEAILADFQALWPDAVTVTAGSL